MKQAVLKATCLVLFFTILLDSNTVVDAEAGVSKPPCQPFNALILWHTGQYSSLIQQSRLLISSIKEFPEDTRVSIATIGAGHGIRLNFTKQEDKDSWMAPIVNVTTKHTSYEEITDREIHKAFSAHDKFNSSSKADIIFILGNNETEINDTAIFEKKKTFIILSGQQKQNVNKKNFWLKLASDEHHYMESNKETEIMKTVEAMLSLLCKDSMFICDTDKYWSVETGKCNTCKFICTKSGSEQPEYCIQSCPYFRLKESGTRITKDINDKGNQSNENTACGVFTYVGYIVAVIVFTVFNRKRFLKCFDSCCGRFARS